ncbi:MAG: ISAs1 family transposase [Kineosporiaceae bacterium]
MQPSRVALLEVLAQAPDPRDPRGVRHPLVGLLAASICAVLTGARSFAAIADWTGELCRADLARLRLTWASPPEETTFRRVLSSVDAAVLDTLIGAFMWLRTSVIEGRRVVAIDGKTTRGARTPTQAAPHLVAMFDQTAGVVLRQLATAAKSNEIPVVRTLLNSIDLSADGGVVVTVDAMHTQTETADLIVAGGGDYVFTVKANQPSLYKACKALPWKNVPAHTTTQTGHGRRATRTIKVVDAPAWITFTGAKQVAQVRRTTTRGGKKSVEVVYVITSADARSASPATLAAWVQNHWGIENRCHYVRDVTFDEDRSRARTGNAPQVMACLRNTAINLLRLHGATNIAAGLRHHAARPERPIKLVLTS